ncbi:MAG: carbon-nitrogen family hydrolase [Deltaproteobacteria bacterium]|uniref:carbon-nitrogen family hydrolase n=1 Tax=Desulfobacula sp. TaxID=2593537 RepID=UPI001983268C|nr:carbon-nitrogen family hydrolase [Candidatus Desulfobacula maris]MBL6995528.1 carbon-nitrogen family hydrolase [Desulfobacula sp.]
MKVASIQMSVVEGDKDATLNKAEEAVKKCGDADLVILPEIWNLGFMSFGQYVDKAENINGPTPTLMKKLAREKKIFLHTGSFVEKEKGNYYNTSLLLSPDGKILAKYRKIHLFGYNSKETQILSPGDTVVVVDTPFGKIGMATCFDLRFPELFRAMVDKGAQYFLVCSAWPYPRIEPWIMLNRVRALENQCFLISANSTGMNCGSQFAGHSMVIDPWGTILAGAGDEDMIIETDIDPAKVAQARETFPGLAGRKSFL